MINKNGIKLIETIANKYEVFFMKYGKSPTHLLISISDYSCIKNYIKPFYGYIDAYAATFKGLKIIYTSPLNKIKVGLLGETND